MPPCHFDIRQKKEYAHALVSSVEKANVFAATFGGAKIRLRIENIFSYKKLSLFSFVFLRKNKELKIKSTL